MEKSISKIIHYCWFGKNPKSELIEKCINSWKKYAPDYEIKEWNEENFDINKYNYARQAYEAGRYAFVSDVARFEILFEEGGIYLDTDVELLKPIDDLLNTELFMAYSRNGLIASGLIMGSVREHHILNLFLDYYKQNDFLLKNGRPNMTTVVTIVSDVLVTEGYKLDGKYYNKDGVVLYPSEYFDPFDFENSKLVLSDEAYSIHHYLASWKNNTDMYLFKIGMLLKRILGKEVYKKLAKIKHKLYG